MLTPGIKGHAALRVTTENTALAMGSGELPVLATPAVAALIERPAGSPLRQSWSLTRAPSARR